MSTTELAVIAVGLLLGYWLVSFFFKSGKQDDEVPAPEPATQPPPEAASSPTPEAAPWHEVLQLAPTATPEEIRAAYFRLAAQYQPDKAQDLGPEIRELAARRLAQIETAYQDALRASGGRV